MLRETSQPNTPPGVVFPGPLDLRRAFAQLREMGALRASPTNPAAVQWVLPFALPLPSLPPRSTASSPGLGGRPCRPDSREEEGKGTPGPCTGGPGASHSLPGACRCPGAGGCGHPRRRPEFSGPGTSPGPPSGPKHRRAGAVERARRTRPAGPAGDPAAAAAAGAGAGGAGCRAQGGAGGAGAAARYSPAPGLCIQGPGPSEPGAHGGRGAGAPPASHPPRSPEAAERL